jgi:hypothetical protein
MQRCEFGSHNIYFINFESKIRMLLDADIGRMYKIILLNASSITPIINFANSPNSNTDSDIMVLVIGITPTKKGKATNYSHEKHMKTNSQICSCSQIDINTNLNSA